MTTIEFRHRSKRVPRAIFPNGEVRFVLGEGTNKARRQELGHQREVMKKLARRGQWEVLRAIDQHAATVDEVVRTVDEIGYDAIRIGKTLAPAEPIGAMVEVFLATVERPTTLKIYRLALDRLVSAVGSDTPWDQVGRHRVNEILEGFRTAGQAPNTRATTKTGWSAFYSWLMERDESLAEMEGRPRRLTIHPIQKSQRIITKSTRHRFLLPAELNELCRVSIEPMAHQYTTLAYTGMRIGEFMSRRPEEVDPASVIQIRARGDWQPKGWPRYDRGVRDIPVHQKRLRPVLEHYLSDYAGSRTVFVNPRTLEPWNHKVFLDQLRRDCSAAKLVYGRGKEDGVTAHTFRHTLPSWLAQADVQLIKIAQILGDTVETVVDFYAHLCPGDLDQTINGALT